MTNPVPPSRTIPRGGAICVTLLLLIPSLLVLAALLVPRRSHAWERHQAQQYLAALSRRDRAAALQVCPGMTGVPNTLDAQLIRWGGATMHDVQFGPTRRARPSYGPTSSLDVTFAYQPPGQTRWLRSRLRIFWQYRDGASFLDVALWYPWLPPARTCSANYLP